MTMTDLVRRRITRAMLLIVVVATYGSLAGCTHKTYIEERRGPRDYHERHNRW